MPVCALTWPYLLPGYRLGNTRPRARLGEVVDHDLRISEIFAFPVTAPYAAVEENRGGGLEVLCALLTGNGRGLRIVRELTNGTWGFRSQKVTKTIWFVFPGTGARI